MEKKNDFVMTVGFNRNDADHVKVVEILNRLGRTKAHYIARAVLTYEGIVIRPSGSVCMDDPVDYSRIRRIIDEAVGQHMADMGVVSQSEKEACEERTEREGKQICESEKGNIMASLKAFRSGGL